MLRLEEADLTSSDERHQLEQVIWANTDVFAVDSGELGSTELVTHTIDTGTQPPIRQQPRRI